MTFNLLGHGATGADLDRWIQGDSNESVECEGCGYTQCHCNGASSDDHQNELDTFDWTEEK